MKRYNSSSNLQEAQSQYKFTNLVNENEALLNQNKTLMKELELIKSDYERFTCSGVRTVKTQKRKKQEINQMFNGDTEVEAELKNAYKKIQDQCEEIDRLNRQNIKLQQETQEQQMKIKNINLTLSEHNALKLRLEQTEKIVLELDEQLELQRQGQNELNQLNQQLEISDKSVVKISQENQRIKSLTETNNKLNKLLEERLLQLENLTRLLNQTNGNHQKEIDKYQQQISQLKQKQLNNTKEDKLEIEIKKLNIEIQKLQQKCNGLIKEKDKLEQDNLVMQNKITEQFNTIQNIDKIISQKDESIKALQKYVIDQQQQYSQQTPQQNQILLQQQQQQEIQQLRQNCQRITQEYNNSQYVISQLNEQLKSQTQMLSQMKQNSQNLTDELNFFRNMPLSTRTNQQLDSPFRKQNLHTLFQENSQKCYTQKKSPTSQQLYLEAERRTKTSNKERFILND